VFQVILQLEFNSKQSRLYCLKIPFSLESLILKIPSIIFEAHSAFLSCALTNSSLRDVVGLCTGARLHAKRNSACT